MALHDYLQEKLNGDYFVEPVLVFSNYVKISFGFNKQKGVYVVQKKYLIDLIKSGKPKLSSEEVEKIVNSF